MSQNQPIQNNDDNPYIGCLYISLPPTVFFVLSWIATSIIIEKPVGIMFLCSRLWHYFENTKYGIEDVEFAIGIAFIVSVVLNIVILAAIQEKSRWKRPPKE